MQKLLKHSTKMNRSGFTVVELMIATMVFSVILVVVTVGVLSFTRSYYRGTYTSMTQNAARSITDSVIQSVQFGADDPTTYSYSGSDVGLTKHFCAGGYVYVFKLGEMYDENVASTTGMYAQPIPSGGCGLPAPSDTTGRRQLLNHRMRIAYLDFSYINGVGNLDIKVTYGDADLLTGTGADMQCKSDVGYEYCAVARMTASGQKRKG